MVATTTAVMVQTVQTEEATKVMTELERYVREYFKDIPLLAEISRCESRFRQFGDNGLVLRGRVNDKDVGIMQINLDYHGEDSYRLGYNVFELNGNLGYALWLYSHYGDDPWIHSKNCWGPYKELLSKQS